MIINSNDIYKLIKSPLYETRRSSRDGLDCLRYDVHNKMIPSDWIHIDIYDTYMEIFKYKNRGSEYYENISATTEQGRETVKRFKKILNAKHAIAVIKRHTNNRG